jgi:hypothetical protein
MKIKPILLGCLITVVVIVLICGIGVFVLYNQFFHVDKPAVLDNPGIILGEKTFDKTILASDAQMGPVTDIRLGSFLPNHDNVIAGVSPQGAVFFDRAGQILQRTIFQNKASHVDIIDIDSTGGYAFLNRGSWYGPASLIDRNGNELWTYDGPDGVDDMCAGDLDGDGNLEFAVGFNGSGGIHLLDSEGNLLWQKDGGNIWHVEIVDTTGNGTMRIVHSDAAGTITVRDLSGSILNRSAPKSETNPYFSYFSLCPWPTSTNRLYALLSEDDAIWLFDYDGTVMAQYSAPDCGTLGDAWGIPAKLKVMETGYMAFIVNFRRWDRAILYIYDPSETLIFKEVMPECCRAITAVSNEKTGTDMILIGGVDKIWSYQMKEGSKPIE